MRVGVLRVVVIAIMLASTGLPSFAQWPRSLQPPQGFPQNSQWGPRQPAPQPVVQNVSVRVPISCPSAPISRPPCGQVQHWQVQTLPVRLQVEVKPEVACPARPALVALRDPGPIEPVISNGVALIGSVVAAPFRLIEILCPFGQKRPCPGRSVSMAYPPPSPAKPFSALGAPYCPQPICKIPAPQPLQCRVLQGACPPTGPSICPLPTVGCPSPQPYRVPPRFVENDRAPILEPPSLIGGLWNVPAALITGGRWTGDLGKPTPRCQP
jgi:hypothetical protein